MFSIVGDIMSTVGVILSTMEDSTVGDIMMHEGNSIMSTVGVFSTMRVLE